MKNERYNKGLENLKTIDGTAGEHVLQNLDTIAPDVSKYIIEFAFGEIYERSPLSMRDKELVTIISLLSQGDTHPQLVVHCHGALNVGLTQDEIVAAFIHCIPYVGFPKVLNALNVLKEVLAGRN